MRFEEGGKRAVLIKLLSNNEEGGTIRDLAEMGGGGVLGKSRKKVCEGRSQLWRTSV